MLNFEDLTEARRSLQRFCRLHFPSIMSQQSGISFKLHPEEPELKTNRRVRHLTTAATCLTSLLDLPPGFSTVQFDRVSTLRDKFVKRALLRKTWKSEGSAGIYCRCRALPLIVGSVNAIDSVTRGHIAAIFAQLRGKSERFGVGEADPDLDKREWYPPNAFHTYWALEILKLVKQKSKNGYDPTGLGLDRTREGMLLWSRQQLAYQIALHSASPPSSLLDSDQLGLSLAIFLQFDEAHKVTLQNRDFVKQAFKCLFSTQTDGTWRHYKPLFHYKEAGNAYCYVFETFAVLLQSALREGPEAEMVRDLLKPYGKQLMDLWRYADSTKIPLVAPGEGFGWCSGHRTNVTSPESWATASVFQYAQALRRLIGIWCREEAQDSLSTPRKELSPEEAARNMASRGETWYSKKLSVAEQLWTMFVNPVRMHGVIGRCRDRLEPDSQPIEKNQARSAILFGPPGTGKTSLIRSLADFIGWRYVELHASHFVAEGLAAVQRTADKIFKQLLELDHAVVLFDEIDELVRERDMERDAFGRFLTTSMLPKLAELWEARKILYFVATNHINYFDSAIIRSHRFDALMLVSPPSFEAKVRQLQHLLAEVYGLTRIRFDVTSEAEIQVALENLGEALSKADAAVQEHKLDPEFALAKFVLLRWDELDELAYRLSESLKDGPSFRRKVSSQMLKGALMRVEDSQWRKNKSYSDYLRDVQSERRDYQMMNVWEPVGKAKVLIPGLVHVNGQCWFAKAVESLKDAEVPPIRLLPKSLGRVEARKSTTK
jgi:ATPase family protein associated with various cellular activities (AAA)